MLTLAALFSFAVVGMAVFVVLALVAGVFKLVFKVAILPLVLVVGLLKLVILPLLAFVVLAALAPVLLAVAFVVLVPLAALAGITWTGVKVAGAVL